MKPSSAVFASIVLMAVAPACSSSPAKSVDASPEVPATATLEPPQDVIFPEAPEVTCSGDAAECPFPPSACADPGCDGGVCPGWAWVVYYDGPTCTNGKCAYVKKYFRCDADSVCSAGGCRFNGTA